MGLRKQPGSIKMAFIAPNTASERTAMAPQAANVAVASCPATATETSSSVDISTRRAGSIKMAFIAPNTASERTAMNNPLFSSRPLTCNS